MHLHLTDSEHATVLAALRFWRQEGMGDPDKRSDALHEIATNGDAVISLDDEGIDDLCERINLESGPLRSVRLAIVSLQHITPEDRRLLQDGTFSVCAVDPDEQDSCFIVSTIAAAASPDDCFPGASSAFLSICQLAHDDGCDLVRFDSAGDSYADLPSFDSAAA